MTTPSNDYMTKAQNLLDEWMATQKELKTADAQISQLEHRRIDLRNHLTEVNAQAKRLFGVKLVQFRGVLFRVTTDGITEAHDIEKL